MISTLFLVRFVCDYLTNTINFSKIPGGLINRRYTLSTMKRACSLGVFLKRLPLRVTPEFQYGQIVVHHSVAAPRIDFSQ